MCGHKPLQICIHPIVYIHVMFVKFCVKLRLWWGGGEGSQQRFNFIWSRDLVFYSVTWLCPYLTQYKYFFQNDVHFINTTNDLIPRDSYTVSSTHCDYDRKDAKKVTNNSVSLFGPDLSTLVTSSRHSNMTIVI